MNTLGIEGLLIIASQFAARQTFSHSVCRSHKKKDGVAVIRRVDSASSVPLLTSTLLLDSH